MQRPRVMPYRPRGEIKRWHQTSPHHARQLLSRTADPHLVERQRRSHESIDNLTPVNVYFGRANDPN
jgi:hypothetical protein